MCGSKNKLFASCFLFALALLLLAGCTKRESVSDSSAAQILRISQRNEPSGLDPHLATLPDDYFVLRALSEGLVSPAPGGTGVVPGVATKWESSEDGLRWTFHLRPDARWSNGDLVTAGDFVYSFKRILSPNLGAPKARLLFVAKNAAAYSRGDLTDFAQVGFSSPNDRTLVIVLEHPAPHLLALASSPAWLPVHQGTLEKFGSPTARDSAWTLPGNYVGNGPFKLKTWSAHREIVVEKNQKYWAHANVRLHGIRFVAMDNGDAEERAFRAGQLDVTLAVPSAKLDGYEKDQPTLLRRITLAETRYLALNTQRAPLSDSRVRRALALAIDRVALTDKVMRGGQVPALTYIPPELGGYSPPNQITGDLSEARQLLTAAGFPNGRDFPRLEISSWVNSPILEAIQHMWKTGLNIDVAIRQREGKVHLAALSAGEFDIGFAPAIPDYNDVSSLFEELMTGAAGNYPHWSNAKYDSLTTLAARTLNPSQRIELYQQAEAILLTELPVIPLYFNTQNFLIHPRVHYWRTDHLWTRFYQWVWLD